MLGLLFFTSLFTGSWISAEQGEQKNRRDSVDNNREFYFDKSGNMRHTKSGKKYTPEEIHQFYNPISLKEKKENYDNKVKEFNRKQFYLVRIRFDKHYFLTLDEAKVFIEEYNQNNNNIKAILDSDIYSISHLSTEHMCKIVATYHFDYDKYVGKYDKFGERR